MKYILKTAFLAVALLFLVTNIVVANDYLTEIVQALQSAPVYVAPGTEGTDNDTSARLQNMLKSGDTIVLVMLPEEADDEVDIYSLTYSLSEKLENQYIIGLAIGKKVVGYAPTLPSGVAADQMRRANSVSNDPITALITYVQNIHTWQTENPQPTSTPQPTPIPPQLPQKSRLTRLLWLLLPIGVVIGIIVIVFRKQTQQLALMKRKRALRPTEFLIHDLQDIVTEIKDNRIRNDLTNACLVALGLLELIQQANKPQGYVEEKFPELVGNMEKQARALIGHESKKHPLPSDTLEKLKEVLLNYDDLFTQLQNGNPQATELVASIIDSNNAMITTLGYLPEDNNQK